MRKLYVSYEYYTEGGEVCEGDEDSRWPSYEPVSTTLHVEGVYSTRPKNWCIEEMECDAKPGDVVYLLVVRYSDGDTFGYSDGNFNFIKLFSNAEEALAEKEKILGHAKPYGKRWDHYFGSLEDVEIYTHMVKL